MDNNNQSNKDNDTRKIFTTLVLVLTLMIFTTGATYAYFALSASDTSTATGTAATVELNLTVTPVTPDSNTPSTAWNNSTKVMVPQKDGGLATAMSSTNGCIDGNGNIVCRVYKIEIENESTAAVRLRGAVYFTINGTYNNLYWRQTTNANTMGNNTIHKFSTAEATNSTTAEAANSTLFDLANSNETNIVLSKADETDGSGSDYKLYYVVVWIREIDEDQGVNAADNKKDQGTWVMNVSFKDSSNGTGVTSTITS